MQTLLLDCYLALHVTHNFHPLAGPDGIYDEEAIAEEVLEPLVRMYYSRTEYDRRAAVRVLTLLKRLPVVADLYARNSIDV